MRQLGLFVILVIAAALAHGSNQVPARDQALQLRKEVSYGVGYHEFGGAVQRMNLDITLVRKGLFDAASPKGAAFSASPAEIDQLSQQWVTQKLIAQGADLKAPLPDVKQWGVRQRLSYWVGANTVFAYVKNALLDKEYMVKGIFDAYGGENPAFVNEASALKGVFDQWVGFLQLAQKQHEERERKRMEEAYVRSRGGEEAMKKRILESIKSMDDPATQGVLDMFRDKPVENNEK